MSVPTRLTGEKNGTKRHILTDGRGVPLAIAITGANVHDVKEIEALLDAVVAERPAFDYKSGPVENLCLDKGYFGEPALESIVLRGYIPHVVPRGIEKAQISEGKKAHRWVVERIHSWLNNFRKLRIRYEKISLSYLGLLMFACAFVCFRQIDAI
jgi:transposase